MIIRIEQPPKSVISASVSPKPLPSNFHLSLPPNFILDTSLNRNYLANVQQNTDHTSHLTVTTLFATAPHSSRLFRIHSLCIVSPPPVTPCTRSTLCIPAAYWVIVPGVYTTYVHTRAYQYLSTPGMVQRPGPLRLGQPHRKTRPVVPPFDGYTYSSSSLALGTVTLYHTARPVPYITCFATTAPNIHCCPVRRSAGVWSLSVGE